MAEYVNFNIGQSETFRVQITFPANTSTGLLNITDYVFTGQVRENYRADLAAEFTITKLTPYSSGSILLELENTKTEILDLRKYVYDVIIQSGSLTQKILEGQLTVRPGVAPIPTTTTTTTTTSTTSTTTTSTTSTTTTSTTTTTTTVAPIEPDYWWRADSGLTTSAWTGYKGNVDFTLYNVTTANSTDGVYFDGSTGYGLSQNINQNIDAKHIFIRFENFATNKISAMLGGTQNNIHEAFFYTAGVGGYYWYFVEVSGSLAYGSRGISPIGTQLLWADFTNGASNILVYPEYENEGYIHSTYAGTFTNRFRWNSGSGIYLGRRQEGNNAQMYVKELAIFTSSLSTEQGKTFREQMISRWPGPTTTTTSTSTTTTSTSTTSTTTTTTLAPVYDNVGPSMTLTRGNNMGLYNSDLESEWDRYTSPSGSEWSSPYVSAYPLVFDEVDVGLVLTRQNNMNGGGLFNTASESGWNFDTYASPEGTQWNSEYTDNINYGWNDLTNVTVRTYDTFYNSLNQQVGNRAVNTELVMYDTVNDKYYKFDITQWGQLGTGTYSYTRQLIDTSSGALIGSPVTVTQSFWNDFSDVTSRTYNSFYYALEQQVGNRAVGTELIMHDTINSKYYKFDITQWGSASQGASYAYNRQEINTTTNTLSGSIVYISRP